MNDRPTIDDLEVLNPDELGKLLLLEVDKTSPDVQFIQDLLTVGCPIEARDKDSWTALHLAAAHGHLEVVEFLLSKGADIHARNNNGCTPLHWAVSYGHLEVVRFLISNGADISDVANNGMSVLDIANFNHNLEIIKFLKSVDLDIHRRDGNTWDRIKSLLRKLKLI